MSTKAGTNAGATQPGGAAKNGKDWALPPIKGLGPQDAKPVPKTVLPKSALAIVKTVKGRDATTGAAAKTAARITELFEPLDAKSNGPNPAAAVVEKMYRPPNILRLPGIKLSDVKQPEDTFDERLLEGVESAEGRTSPLGAEGVPYDKIPSEFTGLEDWPTSTNLKCWVCDFNFSDRPKFVALSFKENETGGYKMGVHGVMCTFNCAELYIETHYLRLVERQHLQELLRFEYFFFTAKWVSRIKPAPPKTEMLQYGGPLDFDAFLKKLRELDPEHGLRDHTPGSILPERLRNYPSGTPETSVSVWDLCSVPAPTAAQRGDTASVWQLLGPGETKPGGMNPNIAVPGSQGAERPGETTSGPAPQKMLNVCPIVSAGTEAPDKLLLKNKEHKNGIIMPATKAAKMAILAAPTVGPADQENPKPPRNTPPQHIKSVGPLAADKVPPAASKTQATSVGPEGRVQDQNSVVLGSPRPPVGSPSPVVRTKNKEDDPSQAIRGRLPETIHSPDVPAAPDDTGDYLDELLG